LRGQGRADLVGPPASRQRGQHDRSAGPLDQGEHRRGPLAQHQVALPMAWDRAVVRLGGPLADRHGIDQLTSSLGQALATRVAHRLARAQAAPQIMAERPRWGTYKLRQTVSWEIRMVGSSG
jgi:hypothetical protein